MKLIKEYRIDGKTVTDEELQECIDISNKENCIVRLIFGYMNNGMPYAINIPKNTEFEKLKEVCQSSFTLFYNQK